MKPIHNTYKLALIIVLLIGAAIGAYFLYKNKTPVLNDIDAAKQEALEVKQGLSKHLVLPDGEEPDIRKINQKLEDPFFVNAEIGDYLIIFYKSRIAYIYSPSKDIITNAGVVFVNPQQASTTKK
ncbi:MAG: hypothetical protein V4576_02905 [Patescibacteria group bacterium]